MVFLSWSQLLAVPEGRMLFIPLGFHWVLLEEEGKFSEQRQTTWFESMKAILDLVAKQLRKSPERLEDFLHQRGWLQDMKPTVSVTHTRGSLPGSLTVKRFWEPCQQLSWPWIIVQCQSDGCSLSSKNCAVIRKLSHHSGMAVDHRCCTHSLVYLGSICIVFIMWFLSATILTEFGLGFLSGNHSFAYSFNEVVSSLWCSSLFLLDIFKPWMCQLQPSNERLEVI